MAPDARKHGSSALRIGVIGAGRIGAFHVRTLLSLSGIASVAVCEADPARAAGLAAELGVAVAATPDDARSRAVVDAVVIATPTPAHAPMIRLAAEAGLPAFCEKPVALDLATIDALIDDVERAGTLVQIGFQRRFDAGYRAARDGDRRRRRSAACSSPVSRRTIPRRRPRRTSRARAASSATSTSTTSTRCASSRARRSSRSTPTAPCARRRGSPTTTTSTSRSRCSGSSGGSLAILSGTRHDPLGYDVRLEAFGTRDSVVVGVDARSPIRSLEPGVAQPDVPAYGDFMQRFQPAYEAELAAFVATVIDGGPSACTLARSARGARSSRSPRIARGANGVPSHPARSPAHRSPRADASPAGPSTRREQMGMQEEQKSREPSGVSRRKLFVAGGLLATGLGSLGAGGRRIRRGRDDEDRGRHPRRHRVVLVGLQGRRRPGRRRT